MAFCMSFRRLVTFGSDETALAATTMIGAGAAIFLFGPPADVVFTRACPGLADAGAALAAYLLPQLPLGLWIDGFGRACTAAAIAIVALLVRRVSGRASIALAVAAACALSDLAHPRFDPAQGVLLLTAAATLLVLVSTGGARIGATAGTIGVMATAALAPPLALPLAALAAGVAWQSRADEALTSRVVRPAAAAAGVLGVAWLAMAVAPGLPPGTAQSCLVPGTAAIAGPAGSVRLLLLSLGPYIGALAVLGAFSAVEARRAARSWLAASTYAAVPLVAALWSPLPSLTMLAPAAVGAWALASVGVRRVLDATQPGIGGRLAAAGLLLLLPVFQVLPWRDEMPADLRPSGHERLSSRDVAARLAAVPPGATIAREELVVDTLVAVETRWRTAADATLTSVDPFRPAPSPLFAFPRTTRGLQSRGFAADGPPLAPGLQPLAWRGGCTVIGPRWRDVPDLRAAASLSVVAARPDERGPIVLYLGFDERPSIAPREWSRVERRGFHVALYDVADPGHRERLANDLAYDDASSSVPDGASPFVVRLELYRTPISSEALTIDLGLAPAWARAQVVPTATPRTYGVCPAFPRPVSGFADATAP